MHFSVSRSKRSLAKFVVFLNMLACLMYTFSLDAIWDGFPSLSLASIANALLLFVSLFYPVNRKNTLVFLLGLVIFFSSLLVNINSIVLASEINVMRAIVVTFLLINIVEQESLAEWMSKKLCFISILGAILCVAQLVSIFVFKEPTLGVNYGTYLKFSGESSFTFRLSPLNGDPNYFAYTLLPGLVVFLFLVFYKGKRNLLTVLPLIFIVFALFSTMSRSAILAASVCVLILTVLGLRYKKNLYPNILLMIFSLFLFLIAWGYISGIRSGNSHKSSSQRLDILRVQMSKINENVFLGNSFSDSKVLVDGTILGAHNLFVEILSSFGVSGLLFFGGVLYFSFHISDILGKVLVISLIISSFFLGLIIYQPFWVFLAFCVCVSKEGKRASWL